MFGETSEPAVVLLYRGYESGERLARKMCVLPWTPGHLPQSEHTSKGRNALLSH